MSFQAMAWAVKQTPAGSKEKFVLLMLANYASNENGDCHPSLNEISDATMLSRDSVIRALKSLEDDGLISVEKKRVGRVNLPNTYSLNLQGVVAHSDQQGSSTQQGGSRKNPAPVVAVCDPNLSLEPIKAKSRRDELDDLQSKIFKAAGLDGIRDERSPSLLNLAPVLGLIDAGFDLDREILPAISFKANSGFVFRSWSLIPAIVSEFAEKRRGAAATPRQAPAQVDWAARVQAFTEDGTWAMAWGPRPGDHGCGAPEELIQKARAAA